MKNGNVVLVVSVFLGVSLALCFLCIGLFFLSGGTMDKALPNMPQEQAPPKTEKPKYTVIIDAGHGGEDGGAVGADGLVEKELNLDIAKRLAALLEQEGIGVIMTRTEDVLLYDRNTDYQGRKKVLDLAARQAIGDANPDAVFISIHANTFSNPIYHGLQIWYGGKSPQSACLAEQMRAEVVETLQPDNHRQSKVAGSNIYLLYHLENPAVLVECGFLSNPAECRALGEDSYRQALAHALCKGILAYYEHEDNAR